MSSRDQILSAIRKNKPAPTELPPYLAFPKPEKDALVEKFQQSSVLNGGRTFLIRDLDEIPAHLDKLFTKQLPVISLLPEVEGNVDINQITDPHDLENIELAILRGTWGVAENAAIWMPDENLVHRVLPFIAQHLAVVIETKHLVTDMHAAYEEIKVDEPGYGVFIAGPSKTADIEQSLVIGAHGPRSMTVFILDNGGE